MIDYIFNDDDYFMQYFASLDYVKQKEMLHYFWDKTSDLIYKMSENMKSLPNAKVREIESLGKQNNKTLMMQEMETFINGK